MKKRRTPQEKKKLSLGKDRRNAYGNNDKAARTGIPRKRALKNRKYRHNVRQAIASGIALPETIDEAASAIRRKEWRKRRDVPLGEMLKRKQGGAQHTNW